MSTFDRFYQSPNFDFFNRDFSQGATNQPFQAFQASQEEEEYNTLLNQFSADGVITQEERDILLNSSRKSGSMLPEAPPIQPIISSTPSPDLEPFNRFNPTTQQFEQLFGNMPAKDQFGNSEQFVQGVRDEAQRNAARFIGQPVTQEQLDQANQLAREIGVTPNFQLDESGNLAVAEYGTDFAARSPEEINRLLNMQQDQMVGQNLPSGQNLEMITDLQGRMISQGDDRTAFDQASQERQARMDQRKVRPGETITERDTRIANSRTQGANRGDEMSQSEARAIAAGENYYATEEDKARGLIIKQRVNKRINDKQLLESAENVKNFLTVNNTGQELTTENIRTLIKATGSSEAAIRTYGNLKENLSQVELNKFNAEVDDLNAFRGAELETPTLFRNKKDGTTAMLALNQKTGQWGSVNEDLEFKPVDINDYRETAYTEISTARKNALDLQTEIFSDVSGIEQLKKFKADRIDSQEGLAQFVTSIKDRFRTAFGQDISPQGMKDAIARAGFERLLGVIRLDVLGPGVLTEQDAQRLIAAMGGFGGLADRETSVKLVERLIKSKERASQGRITVYNQTRNVFDELRNELPKMTMDNVDSIRRGNFLDQNPTNNNVDINSLFKP